MKKIKVGINGFGRIGRVATRILFQRPDMELVAINSRADASSHAYLLKYDSSYGIWDRDVTAQKNVLKIEGRNVPVGSFSLPTEIPWDQWGADIVIDATGKFNTSDELKGHLRGHVKYVILSAPAKDNTKTIVMGVNHDTFNPQTEQIVSNSSCTTNCLATTLKVIHESLKVRRGFMTTTHAVTDSQNLLDNSHKKDVRLRRAAFSSMIPASTGSAKDIGKLYPELDGYLLCQSVRVPLPTVSLLNLVVETEKTATKESVNMLYQKASEGQLKNIISVAHDELVSHDYIANPHSSVIDPYLTQITGDNLINISAWYDNEWGYTQRVIDLVGFLASKGRIV